jgi:peptide/nickel transport system permease protein
MSYLSPGFDQPVDTEAFEREVRETVTAEPSRRLSSFLTALGRNRKAAVGIFILLFFGVVAIIGPWAAPYDPNAYGIPDLNPSQAHWLGTTHLGQDVFSQLLVGTRASLLLAVSAGLIATVISCAFGLTAGYVGGIVDDVLSLITNAILIIPTLPLLIVVATYATQFNIQGMRIMIIVIAITSWPWGARVLRSQMLSLRQKDFVFASKVAGESWFRTIWDEIIPNMISLIVANFIGTTLYALLFSVSLQYLGLTDVAQVSWGSMLFWAQNTDALLLGKWLWFVPVGLCIALFGTGLALTNYAIDELTNPRLRTQRVAKSKPPRTDSTSVVEERVLEPTH